MPFCTVFRIAEDAPQRSGLGDTTDDVCTAALPILRRAATVQLDALLELCLASIDNLPLSHPACERLRRNHLQVSAVDDFSSKVLSLSAFSTAAPSQRLALDPGWPEHDRPYTSAVPTRILALALRKIERQEPKHPPKQAFTVSNHATRSLQLQCTEKRSLNRGCYLPTPHTLYREIPAAYSRLQDISHS